ncbi:MAG: glycosyltransferase [Chryseosolibacter sp.]
MSLKILFLTPWYPDEKMPHHGVFVRDQASAVSERHQVTVLSSKVDYSSFSLFSWTLQESVFRNVREYRLIVKRSIPLINQFNYLLISVWVAWKIGQRVQPDIIHGNIAYPGGIWSWCVSKLLSRPFIISDHTSKFTDNFRSTFHRIATLFSLRRAKSVIAVSAWAATQMKPHLQRKVDIVPNLIHVDDYSMATVAEEAVQIGFLGGLSTNRKGLDVLLKALATIKKPFVLHIGGGGKKIEWHKDLAQTLGVANQCRFHGFVDSVPDFMHQFNFFISSSRMEAFGMVIVEAMACGLPVVVTDSGGPADFMDASCGIMVPPEDVEQLRNAVEWMIDHYHTFDRNRIRMKAVSHYSPVAFLKNIQPIYDTCLQG